MDLIRIKKDKGKSEFAELLTKLRKRSDKAILHFRFPAV
jgi:hypothetical protein